MGEERAFIQDFISTYNLRSCLMENVATYVTNVVAHPKRIPSKQSTFRELAPTLHDGKTQCWLVHDIRPLFYLVFNHVLKYLEIGTKDG